MFKNFMMIFAIIFGLCFLAINIANVYHIIIPSNKKYLYN
ncbi:MAG: hypothetical protein ACD_46C00113G0009 [uncultured bacterium]|nr:MAG: hypothetical protein ACD_46C00113G0009 [uncultured bacterium]